MGSSGSVLDQSFRELIHEWIAEGSSWEYLSAIESPWLENHTGNHDPLTLSDTHRATALEIQYETLKAIAIYYESSSLPDSIGARQEFVASLCERLPAIPCLADLKIAGGKTPMSEPPRSRGSPFSSQSTCVELARNFDRWARNLDLSFDRQVSRKYRSPDVEASGIADHDTLADMVCGRICDHSLLVVLDSAVQFCERTDRVHAGDRAVIGSFLARQLLECNLPSPGQTLLR